MSEVSLACWLASVLCIIALHMAQSKWTLYNAFWVFQCSYCCLVLCSLPRIRRTEFWCLRERSNGNIARG
ncbi:hypothetical protein BDU57DRAFT_566475 [Ampelomyces quisqualis]|uniref:Secreted protein n=1 Tax=Ampelomyces quisqualis TaxID=50730 RepID=A0A6A5Q8D8_AMPQU|nr:hypothetical protein BDU57DRAFT_566475 [Ampelomyces quisqualis]